MSLGYRRAKFFVRDKVYLARYLGLRALGYKTVNRECRNWEVFPTRRMARALDFILARARVSCPVSVAVDHGCGSGRYNEVLRRYARTLIGVDVLPCEAVSGYDTYVQVPAEGAAYLGGIRDSSVDLVFIIASIGMHPAGKYDSEPHCGDWEDYIQGPKKRQTQYFSSDYYPRVVRSGGHIVIQEWEAYPEQRFGKIGPAEVHTRIDRFYPHAEVPGFSMVIKGISPLLIGPYIVYRKQ